MNKNELADVYDRFKNTVYRVALTYCRNIQDAEDITHEVFLARYREDRDFPNDELEKAWLIRVTINKCRNLLRSFGRRNNVELGEIDAISPSPEESEVFAAVNSLPEKYRILIYLRYYEGYSVKETAELTSRSETAVQTQLYRARKQLKKILKEDFD